jgi:hypothetical protein
VRKIEAPIRGRPGWCRARHADPEALLLDLDLAESGLVEQIRKLANQLLVEDGSFGS